VNKPGGIARITMIHDAEAEIAESYDGMSFILQHNAEYHMLLAQTFLVTFESFCAELVCAAYAENSQVPDRVGSRRQLAR